MNRAPLPETGRSGEDEGRRKEYRITPEGRAAVRAELARLQELTANGEALTRDWT